MISKKTYGCEYLKDIKLFPRMRMDSKDIPDPIHPQPLGHIETHTQNILFP